MFVGFPEEEEEEPPTYDLRRRRSLWLSPQDASDHVDSITAFDVNKLEKF